MKYGPKLYSIQAGVFLAGNLATGQVIYTDIDPDLVLDGHYETYLLDLNNDGIDDFKFQNFSGTFYSWMWSDYIHIEEILVGPLIDKNQIAGNIELSYGGYSNFFYQQFPYVLKHENNIGSWLNWEHDDTQLISLKQDLGNDGGFVDIWNCNWYNRHISQILDGYLAVSITNDYQQFHFGWIRCDVIDSGGTLIIKDYAYEAAPKTPILAGQMPDIIGGGGVVSIDNESQADPSSIYAFGKTIYIHSKQDEYKNAVVLNMQGQLVYQQTLTNNYSEIVLTSVPPGIYQVIIQSHQSAYSAKVMLAE